MTAAVGTIAPLVKVGGSELGSATLNALIGMKVSAGLRVPGRAQLDFLDEGFSISADETFTLGTSVSVAAADGTALFTGEVTGVELDVERGAPNLRVIADDAAYKLTLGNKVQTFTNRSYSDIVKAVVSPYGISLNATATTGQQEYVLQSDSDFGFVTEIADRIGYDWWVDPTGTMQFCPMNSGNTTATLNWHSKVGRLEHFSVRASALHPQEVTANGWDSRSKKPVTSTSTKARNQPDAHFVEPYLAPKDLSKDSEVSTAYRSFGAAADGKAIATSAAVRALSGAVIADGVCEVNPAITVGNRVTVEDVGPASGTYPVTEVEHTYNARGFRTRFVAGDREPTSLADTLAAPTASSFRQDALVVGLVTNLGNSDSPPGHIKVKYPTLGEKVESAWARVVSSGAGKSRGMTFLPEVNDEVIVGFEGGDTARPLVLGGLYSSAGSALDFGVKDGSIERRQIVSRLGHVIELGDGQGEADQHIWLTLAGGEFAVKLGKDGLSAEVPSGKPVLVKAGNSKFEISKEGDIALAGKNVSITADQKVEVSATTVKLDGKQAFEASGSQAKIAGKMTAEVSAGAETAIKGGMVKIN